MGFLCEGLKNDFEIAVVKPSVFEPLKYLQPPLSVRMSNMDLYLCFATAVQIKLVLLQLFLCDASQMPTYTDQSAQIVILKYLSRTI